jgi:hypothetical protein
VTQLVAAAASSLQVVVVVVASVTVKFVVTELPVVEPLAGELMATAGLIESTVNVVVAVPEPEALVAVTSTVWLPCERPLVANGDVQATAVAASSLQVMLVGEPVVVKTTDGDAVLTKLPLAGELMLTVGGGVTVKVVDAEPGLPAWSVAVTVIVWLPAARPL